MLIRGASLLDGRRVDVRCRAGAIAAVAPALRPEAGEQVIEAGGGALLPGLNDHHIHLFALAAALASVACGPPAVADAGQLAAALRRAAPAGEWLRGVGYHESVAGPLDRWLLDRWVADRPLRIQHRSGKMWFLNSLACQRLGLDREPGPEGIERDARGRATGRLFRLDEWLGQRLRQGGAPDLGPVSQLLASGGVTGVTDAGADNGASAVAALDAAAAAGRLRQRLLVMGGEQLPAPAHPLLSRGPLKLLLDDHRLPEWDVLLGQVTRARQRGRAVAIHCVTRTELVFALAVLDAAGRGRGDRIEHASVAPDDAMPLLRSTGVTVVTQHGFILERGDRYLQEVPLAEHDLLYRGRSFIDAGVPLAGGSDAPYGSADPWLAMRAAVDRRSAGGHRLGESERLTPEGALRIFTGTLQNPGGPPRTIAAGQPADLCLLDRPWAAARLRLNSGDVVATWVAGDMIYCALSHGAVARRSADPGR